MTDRTTEFPHPLLEDPTELASFKQWSAEVYRDFLAIQAGKMTREEFRERYLYTRAILVLDLTGFTEKAMDSQIASLLRIFDAQKVSIPVVKEFNATMIRTFADNIVALFEKPDEALDAALEIHKRVDEFARAGLAGDHPAKCCIGVGYGEAYAIGVNHAMGAEMNQASKLGEDIARGEETLITASMHAAVSGRDDLVFVPQETDDQLFPYFSVHRPGN